MKTLTTLTAFALTSAFSAGGRNTVYLAWVFLSLVSTSCGNISREVDDTAHKEFIQFINQ